MSSPHQMISRDGSSSGSLIKLMVSAFVCSKSSCPLSAEVRRGMPILSSEGLEVGKVAAVVLNAESHQATHILLGHLPDVSGYWMVPVDWIEAISDSSLRLSEPKLSIASLPRWQSE